MPSSVEFGAADFVVADDGADSEDVLVAGVGTVLGLIATFVPAEFFAAG